MKMIKQLIYLTHCYHIAPQGKLLLKTLKTVMFSFINGVSEGLFRIQDNVTSLINLYLEPSSIYSYILTIAVFNSCIDLKRC